MSKEKSYYDYWGNPHPICPYCDEAAEGFYAPSDEMTDNVECGNCEKTFETTVRFTVTYQTLGDCKKNCDMPHKFKRKYGEHSPYECENCHKEFYAFHLPDGKYPKLKDGEFVIHKDDQAECPDL